MYKASHVNDPKASRPTESYKNCYLYGLKRKALRIKLYGPFISVHKH